MSRKLLGTPFFPKGQEEGEETVEVRVLSPEESKAFHERIRKANEQREARDKEAERRRTRTIKLKTQENCVCGYRIMYRETVSFVRTGSEVFGGRTDGHWSTHAEAFCGSRDCSIMYLAGSSRFRKARAKIKTMRQPPGDDWVPEKEKGEK